MAEHLTAGDLLEITQTTVTGMTLDVTHPGGLSPKELRTWCDRGVVTPASGGNGPGDHRIFTPLQAFAVTYAAQWWRCGAGLAMVKGVIDCIVKEGEKRLKKKAIQDGWVCFVAPGNTCRFVQLRDLDNPYIDVRHVYAKVMEKIAEIEKRPAKRSVSRSRGLADTK